MIAWLSGSLAATGTNFIVLNVNGVGYMVYMTQRALAQLNDIGMMLTIHVETQVREDAITLFGFYDTNEKEWFQRLTTVQGVGAKMALNLLSALSPDMLLRAIMADDKAALTQADGVGPKLALRLLTELKEPAKKLFLQAPQGTIVTSGLATKGKAKNATPVVEINSNDALIREATSALVNLGYGASDALAAVSKVTASQDNIALSDLIRAGLKEISA
ncbi:MAG TPA: Holliday junction branch migration protein RuvA [Alphaproteobacteria bacterium]